MLIIMHDEWPKQASPARAFHPVFTQYNQTIIRQGSSEGSQVGNGPGNPAALSRSDGFRPVALRPTFSSGLPLG
jgi:hypothetical protein